MNHTRVLSDPVAVYKAAVFSLLLSETFDNAKIRNQPDGEGVLTQVHMHLLVPPGSELLRFVVYGSWSHWNPYRFSEALRVSYSLLPEPEHFITILASRTSAISIYMKKFFHNMTAMHGKLSLRFLSARGIIEDKLLQCRRQFPTMKNPLQLLRYLSISDINVWAIGHFRRLLDRAYVDLVRLSVQVECDDTADMLGPIGYPRRNNSLFAKAEEVMVTLEELSVCFERIEKVMI
jgi:hypothetical protein